MASRNGSVVQEMGSTGLIYAQGGIIEEELNPRLQGREAIRIYREMSENDPLIGAIMYAIDMLVRQVKWKIEANDGTEEDSEFLESCMYDMSHSWSDFISEVMSMLRFGFSFHEIVYKRRMGSQPETGNVPTSKYDDGKIGWRKLPIRSQDTLDHWDIDMQDQGIKGFVQKSPPDWKEVTIPITKGLLFRTTSYKGNPEGRSLLRNAYRPWYYKKRIEEIEGVGIERDLAGFPMFEVPADWLSDQADSNMKAIIAELRKIGANIRRDKQEYLIMPVAYDDMKNKILDFKLMNSGGSRTFDTSSIIQRYDQRIAMTVLADFILLGHEKVGSFALSSDKTDIFAVSLGTILDGIQDVINRFAVTRLWEVNGFDVTKQPEVRHGDIEDQELTSLGTYLQTLASLGLTLFPDDDLEKHLREIAHLPEVSEETKRLREQQGTESEDTGNAGDQQGQEGQGEEATGEQEAEANPFADLIG